jgi:ribonuclease H2 subunit B
MLLHIPVDPLFSVIPIIESLLQSSSTHFQPLEDLIAQAGVDPRFALPEPFSKEPAERGFNDDISRLLSIKSVRRVFKACCEKKSKLSHSKSRSQLTPSRSSWPTLAIIFNR